jgi:hypothetical protein
MRFAPPAERRAVGQRPVELLGERDRGGRHLVLVRDDRGNAALHQGTRDAAILAGDGVRAVSQALRKIVHAAIAEELAQRLTVLTG